MGSNSEFQFPKSLVLNSLSSCAHVFLEAFAHINHSLLTSGTRREHTASCELTSHVLLLLTAGCSADKFGEVPLQSGDTKPAYFADIIYASGSLPLSGEVSAALHPWDYQKRWFSSLASEKDISTSQMLFVYLTVLASAHNLTKLPFQEKQLSKATNTILPRAPHATQAGEFTAVPQKQLTNLLAYSAPNIEDLAREFQTKNTNLVPYLGYFATLYQAKCTASEFFRVVCENSFVVQHWSYLFQL